MRGNRIVGEAATAWAVIKAMGRVFPLLLEKSIKKAEALGLAEDDTCLEWARQVSIMSWGAISR